MMDPDLSVLLRLLLWFLTGVGIGILLVVGWVAREFWGDYRRRP